MLRNGDVALAAPFTVLVSALLLQAQQPGGVGFHSVELERLGRLILSPLLLDEWIPAQHADYRLSRCRAT
jgi:hypothetical protein